MVVFLKWPTYQNIIITFKLLGEYVIDSWHILVDKNKSRTYCQENIVCDINLSLTQTILLKLIRETINYFTRAFIMRYISSTMLSYFHLTFI